MEDALKAKFSWITWIEMWRVMTELLPEIKGTTD
jgi:hypothetical protein